MDAIVSVEWLAQNRTEENIIILDATLNKDNETNPTETVIDNAIFFDIKNNFSDKNSAFPNTIPKVEEFEKACRKLGINNSSKIIVYDKVGIYSSPRVWWLFKSMGHEKIYVLNGGLPEWKKKGYPTTQRKSSPTKNGNFKANLKKNNLVSYQEVLANIKSKSFLLIDARSEGRFYGTAKEPRKWIKSGHIPNSINIPYQDVLTDGKFKSAEKLKKIFKSKCTSSENLVFTCGSGLTACIIMLASEIAYKKSNCIYDGSWTEYAELQNLKAITE